MPSRLGRYEIIRHLESGGMAELYIARQEGPREFARHVVLKTLAGDRARDEQLVAMFLDEARLAATLHHQNIVQVYEVDCADQIYFMAMEYVHGENARALVARSIERRRPLPLGIAISIISAAAAGLHYAHERCNVTGQPLGIVHRDVSLSNLLVGHDGCTKILDFGIAKALERRAKTVAGTVKGKSGYMSPEQCLDRQVDRRSDVFSLGICLYELTTLRRAFRVRDEAETMRRIMSEAVVPPSAFVSDYPDALAAIVRRALEKEPDARYQTMLELGEALESFARSAELLPTSGAVARYISELCGERPPPLLDEAAEQTRRVFSGIASDREQTLLEPFESEISSMDTSLRRSTSSETPTWTETDVDADSVHAALERPSSVTEVYERRDVTPALDEPASQPVDESELQVVRSRVRRPRHSPRLVAIRLATAATSRLRWPMIIAAVLILATLAVFAAH